VRHVTQDYETYKGDNMSDDKVVSITDAPKKKDTDTKQDTEELSFEEIVKKNMENKERMKRERAKANKGVVRSHRLKK
jgi:hypothetical protein